MKRALMILALGSLCTWGAAACAILAHAAAGTLPPGQFEHGAGWAILWLPIQEWPMMLAGVILAMLADKGISPAKAMLRGVDAVCALYKIRTMPGAPAFLAFCRLTWLQVSFLPACLATVTGLAYQLGVIAGNTPVGFPLKWIGLFTAVLVAFMALAMLDKCLCKERETVPKFLPPGYGSLFK